MSEERKPGFFEYKARQDLGIRRGSDENYFVPVEFVEVKTAEMLEAGEEMLERISRTASNLGEKVRELTTRGVVRTNNQHGEVYHASSD